MTRFLTWLLTNALALAAAAWLVEGIRFTGAQQGQDELTDKVVPLLVVAAVLGVVTAVVRPVARLVSLPLVVLTLGLFLLVINAAMLLLTGWVAEQLEIGFRVTGFWPAVAGAIVITVVTWAADRVLDRDDR